VPLEPGKPVVTRDEPPLGAEQVEAPVDDDPMQPGTERPPLVEPGQRRECPLEGVLRDVVGELAASGDDVGGAPGSMPVAGEELRRRVP